MMNTRTQDYDTNHVKQSQLDAALTTTESISPPISRTEACRDSLLRLFDSMLVQVVGIVVLILIILDGALFFFLLMGWHTLCRPRLNCELRNQTYNISIHILNVLFTYSGIVSFPWRITNWMHLTCGGCPQRSNQPGKNLYGVTCNDVWFHIPRLPRLCMVLLFLLNAICQFINQGTRVVYYSYELQDSFPGNIWTNVFFGLSFLSAAIGAVWLGIASERVRMTDPVTFGPSLMEAAGLLFQNSEQGSSRPSVDPTRAPQRLSVLNDESRASLRMLGM